MSVPKEHHYVPQFYFRNFSHDPKQRSIHLLRKATGQIVFNAPIKGQSKRRNLYIVPEIECVFSHLEGGISNCFRRLIDDSVRFSILRRLESIHYPASTGFVLQATRLPQRGDHFHESFLPLFQTAMQIDVSKNPQVPKSVRDELDRGELHFDYDSRYDVLDATHVAMFSPMLFFDMTMILVANATELPFVFSDEPAICTNRFLWEYRDFAGITGFGSRGLIAFMPLCERLTIFFFDGGAYKCNKNIGEPIVLDCQSDVELLNAFQMHSATDVIYFGDQKAEEYVQRLHRVHQDSARPDRFVVKHCPSEDGTSELVVHFERALPVFPDFSFLELRRRATLDHITMPRNEELLNVTDRMCFASKAQDSTFTQQLFESTIHNLFPKTAPLRERC